MRSLMLIAMFALTTTAFAEENGSTNRAKFEAYKQRLAQRRAYALELRRQYNATKAPHVYRTSTYFPGPRLGDGFVVQPPIPLRPVISVPYPSVVYTSTHLGPVRPERTPLVHALVAK